MNDPIGMATDRMPERTAGVREPRVRQEASGTSKALPAVLFFIDLDWQLQPDRVTALPGSEPLVSHLGGKDLREVCRDLPEVLGAFSRAFAGEKCSSLVRIGDFTYDAHYAPVRDEDGEIAGATALCLDVTARERALLDVRDYAERFRAFAQSSLELVTFQDRRGFYIWANDLHERLLGVPAESLIGRSSLTLVHPEDREALTRAMDGLTVEGGPHHVTFRACASDGRILWLSTTARIFSSGRGPDQLLTVSHDVTHEVALQQRLERQAENERSVSELSRRLMSLPPERMLDAVRAELGEVAQLAGADYTMLLITTGRGDAPFLRYDWPEDLPPSLRPDTSLETARQTRYFSAVLPGGGPLHIPSPDSLPEEARFEREDLIRRGVKSNLTIPLRLHDRMLGVQVFETREQVRHWSDEETTQLTLLGEVLARAVERDHVHATLTASEERFRALSENIADILLEIDESGNLVWASPSFEDILGRDPETIFGSSMGTLIHPDDLRQTRWKLGLALREAKTAQATFRGRHADGRWIWLETRGRGFRTSSGAVHYVGHARDITDHRQAIERLERQHHADREIARLSSRFLRMGAEELDAGLSDGIQTVVAVARADRAYLLDITRRPRQIVPSREWSWAELDRAVGDEGLEYAQRFRWAVEQLRRGDVLRVHDASTLSGEAARVGEDLVQRGVRSLLGIPILADGRLAGYLGVEYLREVQDWGEREISELQMLAGVFAGALQRRRAERDLALQLEFERRVFELSQRFLGVSSEGLPAAIHEALAETGALAEVDRTILLSFPVDASGVARRGHIESFEWCAPGIASTQIEPSRWKLDWAMRSEIFEIPVVDEMPDEYRAVRERLQSRGVQSFMGLPIRTPSGYAGFLGLETHRERKQSSEQQISMYRLLGELFGSALQRMQAERALQDSRLQLMHSQKMEAVGRLAGGVAHDFNNLLTVILGYSRSMLAELPPESGHHEDAEAIADAAERAAALTSQLLTFGRRQSSVSRTADLEQIVRGLRTLLGRLLGASFELVFESSGHPCWAKVDSAQIEQALVNLVVNARDAMVEGGRIGLRVHSEQLDADAALYFGLEAGGLYHLLEIEDQGVGIQPAMLERIFEPFFTTKGAGKGTGLGLSIVYSVVKEHQGGVAVENRAGGGTRFTMAFPANERAPVVEATRVEEATSAGEETILLVEDEPQVRRLLTRVFRRAGYRVVAAADGEQALELIAEQGPELMNLLVTDIVMPGINGGELARRVRALDPQIPILYLSGHPQDRGPLSEAPDLPSGGYLTKPFEEARLLAEVRLALEGAH
jgi:PAS domain S-box-containing protein